MSKRGVGSPKGKLGNSNEREERDKAELEIVAQMTRKIMMSTKMKTQKEKEDKALV